MPAIQKRMSLIPKELLDHYNSHQKVGGGEKVSIVNTIKVPRNLGMLKENLPVSYSPNSETLLGILLEVLLDPFHLCVHRLQSMNTKMKWIQ
jgi:hypothetical protein